VPPEGGVEEVYDDEDDAAVGCGKAEEDDGVAVPFGDSVNDGYNDEDRLRWGDKNTVELAAVLVGRSSLAIERSQKYSRMRL
jgi:hypothetical protein